MCAQPRNLYFAWQLEVMLNNFIKNGISQSDIIVLVATKDNDIPMHITMWDMLTSHFKFVNFYFYEDTRNIDSKYVSAVRPHIIKKHFLKFTELEKETIFYHDCDIVFTKPVDFSSLCNDDIWYLSNTINYISYNYIISKGKSVYDRMCEIVGIDKNIPKLMNNHSGGAQYIMKGLTYEYWDKVERDSEILFSEITNMNIQLKKDNPDYHSLQIWCADMWAVLWNAWLFGFRTELHKELDFIWPHQLIENWNNSNIFHNSGVMGKDSSHLFKKSNFTNTVPYKQYFENHYYSQFCSYNYYNEIIETSKITCFKPILNEL